MKNYATMIWKLPENIEINPEARKIANESVAKIADSIIGQSRILESLSANSDLREFLKLTDPATEAYVQSQHLSHALSMIKFHSKRQKQKEASASVKARLLRLASRIQDEEIKKQIYIATAKLLRIEVFAEVSLEDKKKVVETMIKKMTRRISAQQKALDVIIQELSDAFKKPAPFLADFDFGPLIALRNLAGKNQDDALKVYLLLKPEGRVF